MTSLTHEELLSAFKYDPSTGVFRWKVRPSKCSNVRISDIAGCLDKQKGYVVIRLNGRLYMAHRLAWFYVTGKWPEHQIDHRDGQRANNAFTNLRDVTNSVNQQNQRSAKKSNKTGLLGVSMSPLGRPRAYITTPDGKVRALGTFATTDQAHAAYLAAKRQLHEGNTL